MLRVLFLMLVLLAGLISGPYISGNQGYVLIETGSHSIEMSITTLVVFFVIAMALVYALEWCVSHFLRLSTDTYSWFSRRKRKKAQQQTLEGLLHMDAGDYTKAERLIGKNAKHSTEPVLNFIKAAEAAQQQGDEFAANRYLIQATEFAGTDNLVVEIARTRILLRQNKLPAARSSVDSLLVMAPRNVEVLKLASEIYLKSKAYTTLEQLMDMIEKQEVFSVKEFTALQHRIDDGLLDEKMNEEGQEGLLNWWDNLPRKRRNDIYLKVGFVKRLIECNDHESAYEVALELLKKTNDYPAEITELLTTLTHLQPTDSSKLVKLLEKKRNEANPAMQLYLNRALAYLYVRSGLFEKAANVFKLLVSDTEHMDLNDANMAIYVFEQVNDKDQVAKVREGALKRAMATTELKEVHSNAEVLEKPTALLEEIK